MAITGLKVRLGELIRGYLKQSKLRQLDFAQALAVSPSAVSQMLSGRMVPSLAQLDTMAQKLALDRNQAAELRDYLARIRTGEEEIRSPLNDFIRSARIRRGLSVGQLSRLTGIPAADLSTLESRIGAQPSPTEAVRLAAVLECDIGDLWQIAPAMGGAGVGGRVSELRDARPAYQALPGIKAPVLRFNTLGAFDPAYDVAMDFAWRHMTGVQEVVAEGMLVLAATGREIGWPPRCEVELLVTPEVPGSPGMMMVGAIGETVMLGESGAAVGTMRCPDGTETACRWCWTVQSLNMKTTAVSEPGGEQ